jgi:hypothetical protein
LAFGPTNSCARNDITEPHILGVEARAGLTTEQWNEQARKVDIGTKREADLYDIRVRGTMERRLTNAEPKRKPGHV